MLIQPIKEGPVEIRFEDSAGKQKVSFIVDFGKTDIGGTKAGKVFKKVVSVLRKELGVSLPRLADEKGGVL